MPDAVSIEPALQRVRAIAIDLDGVLTNGGLWWEPDGAEWKRFSFHNIMGISLGRRPGLALALISGEDIPLVDTSATKLSIQHVFKGCREKAPAPREFAGVASDLLANVSPRTQSPDNKGAVRELVSAILEDKGLPGPAVFVKD